MLKADGVHYTNSDFRAHRRSFGSNVRNVLEERSRPFRALRSQSDSHSRPAVGTHVVGSRRSFRSIPLRSDVRARTSPVRLATHPRIITSCNALARLSAGEETFVRPHWTLAKTECVQTPVTVNTLGSVTMQRACAEPRKVFLLQRATGRQDGSGPKTPPPTTQLQTTPLPRMTPTTTTMTPLLPSTPPKTSLLLSTPLPTTTKIPLLLTTPSTTTMAPQLPSTPPMTLKTPLLPSTPLPTIPLLQQHCRRRRRRHFRRHYRRRQ